MDCRTARHLLEFARARYPELEASAAEVLESHLADCPECGPLARTERQIDDRIGRVLRAVPVPDGLRDRLLGRLDKEQWLVRRTWLGRAAVAATVLLAIGLGLYWHFSQPIRFALEPLVALRVAEPKELDDWFAAHGLPDIEVPRQFDYGLLHHHGIARLHGREVAELWFMQGPNYAHVYVLPGKQFDLNHLQQQDQGMAQGSQATVKLIRHPENPQIAYLVIYTGGSLEPFFAVRPPPF